MKNHIKKLVKKQNGITLIALVITIIVLLILAGVSIATLTGNNGLLTKTSDAKNKTIIGEETEQVKLAYNAVISSGEEATAERIQEELDKLVGKNKANVTEKENSVMSVLFNETTNLYNMDGSGVSKIEMQKLYISNYDELYAFAQRVNNGEEFDEYIVYLVNDITMPDEDWIVIGDKGGREEPAKVFKGIFEGNNKSINNLKFNKYGLFYANYGVIRNLNVKSILENNASIGYETYSGAITGSNHGIIKGCSAEVNWDAIISGIGGSAGGITGYSSGTIENCISKGNIRITGGTNSNLGGIVGEASGSIINCVNYANISNYTNLGGGIVGIFGRYGGNVVVEKCINYGDILSGARNCYAGGITGECNRTCRIFMCANKGSCDSERYGQGGAAGICYYLRNNASIESCYNSGSSIGVTTDGIVSDVSSESRVSNCFVCNSNTDARGVIHWTGGGNEASGIFTNCYYNKDLFADISNVSIGTGLTAAQMKSPEFLSMIGNNFKADTNNINNSFPVLSFE